MTAERKGEHDLVHATFEGAPIEGTLGSSVAAALIASDRVAWRTTRGGAQRGLFCGIGVCFDCLVEIDGESGQRACMIPLTEGMRVCGMPVAGEGAGEGSERDNDSGHSGSEHCDRPAPGDGVSA